MNPRVTDACNIIQIHMKKKIRLTVLRCNVIQLHALLRITVIRAYQFVMRVHDRIEFNT